jgi:hypothetical protein
MLPWIILYFNQGLDPLEFILIAASMSSDKDPLRPVMRQIQVLGNKKKIKKSMK